MLGWVVFLCALAVIVVSDSAAGREYNDIGTPEGWAWQEIRNGGIADLARRTPPGNSTPCGPLDPKKTDPDDHCHLISAQFVVDALSDPRLQAQVDRHGFRLRNARIIGGIDLSGADIPFQVGIPASRIEGSLLLGDSHLKRLLYADNATITGGLRAERATFDSSLLLRNATFGGDVDLGDATVGGDLFMSGSSFAGKVNLSRAEVKGGLFLSNRATIDGDVDLGGATVGGNLEGEGSSFAQRVNLSRADVKGSLLLGNKATFGGDVNLAGAMVGSDLEMDGLSIHGTCHFNGAKVGGTLDLGGASITGSVDLDKVKVDGSLFLSNKGVFGSEVNLRSATVGSNLEMSDSSFAGPLTLQGIEVKGGLYLFHTTVGGIVNAQNATIGGAAEMRGSAFAQNLNFRGADLKSQVSLGNANVGGRVDFSNATIGENLDMSGASIVGDVGLEHVKINGSLFLRNKTHVEGLVDLVNTTVGGNLELENSSFTGALILVGIEVIPGVLDLNGATASSIALRRADVSSLVLSGLGWWCPRSKSQTGATVQSDPVVAEAKPTHWPLSTASWRDARCHGAPAPSFDLRNAHVGAFQDSPDAWPPVIYLEGFHYDRLGSVSAGERNEMHQRAPKEWTDWIARNPVFSTQPFTQLSSVLLAAGDRGDAEAIRFAGREAERHRTHDWLTWAWLTVLAYVAGYGIGAYTFFVLGWVLLLTLIGAVLLWLSPQARAHSFAWRFGASLHRVLPVIELSKDFTDFFDALSQQRIFPRWRKRVLEVYFVGHAIAGYVLGFFLIAAIGGLTQNG